MTGIGEAVAVTAGGTWHAGGQGAARSAFACAVLRDGTVECWGYLRNILGTAGVDTSSVPLPVPGVAHALAIAGGDAHVCVLLEGGSVECWGVNEQGELGNGLTPLCSLCASDPAPVAVSTLSGAMDVAGKGSQFTCSALADGSVHCWGAFNIGPASLGTTVSAWPAPILGVVTSPGGMDVGYFHACAVMRDDGRVQCWGQNHLGELGDNPDPHDFGPITVAGTHSAVAVAAGNSFSCALLSDASVQCWGTNAFGQLGDGTLVTSTGAVTVVGLTDATAISAGYNHACAVTKAGSIRCWGAIGAASVSVPTTVAGF